MVPCKSTSKEVSFEWSHHRILSTDSNVRTALYASIINFGSERIKGTCCCSCHRYEYGNEKDCMKKHIKSCLTGSLVSYVDLVTSLLLHQVYHCGDVKYIPSPFDAVIMKVIKCKQEAFMDTDFCWSYFRDRLNANRSDPLLCR